MKNDNQLNILILCATDKTANLKPTRLQNNIDYISNEYFKNKKNITRAPNIYYMGIQLVHKLDENKCNARTDELIDKCNYKKNMFDIILSEYCPSFSYITVNTPTFFNNIYHLLRKNGIYSIILSDNIKKFSINYGSNIINYDSTEDYAYEDFFKKIHEDYSLLYINSHDIQYTHKGILETETWAIIKKVDTKPANNTTKLNNTVIPSINVTGINRNRQTILTTTYKKNMVNFINY